MRPLRWATRGAGEDAWLGIEVYRPELNYLGAAFCRQEHAAEWLARPLPPVEPVELLPRDWRDRAVDAGLLALFLWAGALMVIGSIALIRVFGGWR